jgi:hypothetical protein
MGQSFLCESFSLKIDKTRRKNETINQTPPTSMDYEKQSGSEDSQPDGSQRLRCTLCPGKSFKDNNRLKIHVDKYHVDNNLSTSSTSSSTESITKLLINLKLQLPTIRRLPKACRHLAADKISYIINNCLSTKSLSSCCFTGTFVKTLLVNAVQKKKPSNTLWKNVPLLNSSKVSPNSIYLPKTP